jgi:hypothetical protein
MAKHVQVDAYLETLPPGMHEMAVERRTLIFNAIPKDAEEFKWGQPTYELDGRVCSFKAAKKHMTFHLFRGASLDDPDGRLEGEGKEHRHVKLRDQSEINKRLFTKWLKDTVKLNQRS